MGSSQSTPAKPANTGDAETPTIPTNPSNLHTAQNQQPIQASDSSSTSASKSNETKQTKNPPNQQRQRPNESGYQKAQRKCNKKKRAYDACYTAQLSGRAEEFDCSELFDIYRSCFLRVMTQDMERRGVMPKEGSMIAEYKEEVADEE